MFKLEDLYLIIDGSIEGLTPILTKIFGHPVVIKLAAELENG